MNYVLIDDAVKTYLAKNKSDVITLRLRMGEG